MIQQLCFFSPSINFLMVFCTVFGLNHIKFIVKKLKMTISFFKFSDGFWSIIKVIDQKPSENQLKTKRSFYLYFRNVHECTNLSKHNLDKYSPPVFKIPEGYHQILLQTKPKKSKGE